MRQKFALVIVMSMILLAGCTSLTVYEASPAETDDELATNYNYNITEQEEVSFNENISAFGFEQDIKMTNWLTVYEKDISNELGINNDTQSPIVFATINSPMINISGQELNPLKYQSNENAMRFISEQTDENIEIGDKVNDTNTTHNITDNNMTISKYEATFKIDELGATFDGHVLISLYKLDDSFVITFGSYPEAYDEEENIIELMKNTNAIDS